MLLVIRCPNCRAASRVDETDLGQTVQCPQCADTFAAIEEAELIAAGPRSTLGVESANGRAAREPAPPPEQRRRPYRPPPEPFFQAPPPPTEAKAEKKPEPATDPDAQFDPHAEPPGSLPASVVIGLALLPFLIPILWLIAPAVIGQEPVLSLASALALAVSASVLCLAVIYTVDWRPGTRLKGVLLLVVLSYVTGIGLYFLKKDFVDRVRKFFGVDLPWVEFEPQGGGYKVKLPAQPNGVQGQQPLGIISIPCHEVRSTDGLRRYRFVVGSSSRPPQLLKPGFVLPALGTDDWFDAAKAAVAIQGQAQGQVKSEEVKYEGKFPGRQLDLTLPDGQTRLVRMFVVKERVYYLAVEGPGIAPDHPDVERFFSSFAVPDAAK